MKRSIKILTAVVLGSAAVVSITAYGHHYWHASDPEQRAEWIVERVSKRLDLTGDQITTLNQLKDRLLTFRSEMKQNRVKTREELASLFAAPQLDQNRIVSIVQEKTAVMNQRAPEFVAALAGFTDSLSEAQRQEALVMMEERFKHRRH